MIEIQNKILEYLPFKSNIKLSCWDKIKSFKKTYVFYEIELEQNEITLSKRIDNPESIFDNYQVYLLAEYNDLHDDHKTCEINNLNSKLHTLLKLPVFPSDHRETSSDYFKKEWSNMIKESLWNMYDSRLIPRYAYPPTNIHKWIDAHCSEGSKKYANAISSFLDYIDWNTFYDHFVISVEKFISEIQRDSAEPVLFLLTNETPGQSNTWILKLFLSYIYQETLKYINGKRVTPVPILYEIESVTSFFDLKCDIRFAETIHVVAIDDGSYSGEQFTRKVINNITNLEYIIYKSYFKRINLFSPMNINFHFIIPFITTQAREKIAIFMDNTHPSYLTEELKGLYNTEYVSKMHLYYSYHIKTLQEKINEQPKLQINKNILEDAYMIGSYFLDKLLKTEKPLIYFDHKIPDHWSNQVFFLTGMHIAKNLKQEHADDSWELSTNSTKEHCKEYVTEDEDTQKTKQVFIMEKRDRSNGNLIESDYKMDFSFRQYGREPKDYSKNMPLLDWYENCKKISNYIHKQKNKLKDRKYNILAHFHLKKGKIWQLKKGKIWTLEKLKKKEKTLERLLNTLKNMDLSEKNIYVNLITNDQQYFQDNIKPTDLNFNVSSDKMVCINQYLENARKNLSKNQ